MTDLPLTRIDGGEWDGRVTLPSWAGGLPGRAVAPDGSAPLAVDSPAAGPTPAQLATVRFLLEHESEVAGAARAAIFERYPEEREATIDAYDGEDAEAVAEELPVLTDPAEVLPLVGLLQVYVHEVERDGFAYVGLQFRCLWEREHGCGVLLHRTRVLEVSAADAALDHWTAKKDAEN